MGKWEKRPRNNGRLFDVEIQREKDREGINIYSVVPKRQWERMGAVFYLVVLLSRAGPPKVMHGAGMTAISSLSLTERELEKCLEALLLKKIPLCRINDYYDDKV